jgi:probable phosphoglycerate mutase
LNVKLAPEAAEIDLGIPLDSPDWRQLYRGLATRWVIDKDLAARIGEGESFADVQRRFLPFVRELMNRHADDTGVVVVVSHGATLGLLVPVLATNVPADLSLRRPLSNTSIIKTELRDGKLFCIEWAGLASGEFGE